MAEENSAGKLVSAKLPTGGALSHSNLLHEFRNHAKAWKSEPTALVSVSNRIVDTVKRAFDKWDENEPPPNIRIVFIKLPAVVCEPSTSVHSARLLAEECGLPEPNLFSHEYVFEWAIPNQYVTHQVSLQTLIDRGLDWREYLAGHEDENVSTWELRGRIALDLQPSYSWNGTLEVGFYLGFFASNFGARAPLNWVARQLFEDCVRVEIMYADTVRLNYAHGHSEIVHNDFFSELDQGINTALFDWWLVDDDFRYEVRCLGEWEEVVEDGIISDCADNWEKWGDRELTAWDKVLYHKESDALATKHNANRAEIEAEAVRIGL